MAITTPRIIGRDLYVTCVNQRTIWQNLTLTFTANTENATASDSTLDEVVFTTAILEGELSVFMGAVNAGQNSSNVLPAPKDTISDLGVKIGSSGGDSVIPSLTIYTNIKVLTARYTFALGPADAAITFRSGVLN